MLLVDNIQVPLTEDGHYQELLVAFHDHLQVLQVLVLLLLLFPRVPYVDGLRLPAVEAGRADHVVLPRSHEHHRLHHRLALLLPPFHRLPCRALRSGDLAPGAVGHLQDGAVAVRHEREDQFLGVRFRLLRLSGGPAPLPEGVLQDDAVFVEGHGHEASEPLLGLLDDLQGLHPCPEGRATDHTVLSHVHDRDNPLRGLDLLLHFDHPGLPRGEELVPHEAGLGVQHRVDGRHRLALLERLHRLLHVANLLPRAGILGVLRPASEHGHHEHLVVASKSIDHFGDPTLLLPLVVGRVLRLFDVHGPRQPGVVHQDVFAAVAHDVQQLTVLEELPLLLRYCLFPSIHCLHLDALVTVV
mmetsp:Transcript_44299/g.117093  ORF Transcript_44299/g.117093 Transcript_44299/m.117093 type:complete len:356 (+) Transcript_44299:1225-2292(+)